ncbi:ribosome biogenesis regulatory protein [Culex quinquefasciatus]|uniref:Ribosome biogenesis regulatory protein n=1 Tax=Culex quinquefasciatus TaxID=7176 RepID=B0WTY4_CULQU|nr:ribosome biogenesis regulatory protein [Culex quinquefasciatus]|eukprot:XP_001870892.1 ribosome biogenesis regulatory protein [Culex quinquefasciatus]
MRVSQERNRPDAEHCPRENDPNSANGLSRTGCRFNQRAGKCCQCVDVVGRRFLEEADQRKAGPRNRREAKARKVSKVLKKKPPVTLGLLSTRRRELPEQRRLPQRRSLPPWVRRRPSRSRRRRVPLRFVSSLCQGSSIVSGVAIQHWGVSVGDLTGMVQHDDLGGEFAVPRRSSLTDTFFVHGLDRSSTDLTSAVRLAGTNTMAIPGLFTPVPAPGGRCRGLSVGHLPSYAMLETSTSWWTVPASKFPSILRPSSRRFRCVMLFTPGSHPFAARWYPQGRAGKLTGLFWAVIGSPPSGIDCRNWRVHGFEDLKHKFTNCSRVKHLWEYLQPKLDAILDRRAYVSFLTPLAKSQVDVSFNGDVIFNDKKTARKIHNL